MRVLVQYRQDLLFDPVYKRVSPVADMPNGADGETADGDGRVMHLQAESSSELQGEPFRQGCHHGRSGDGSEGWKEERNGEDDISAQPLFGEDFIDDAMEVSGR